MWVITAATDVDQRAGLACLAQSGEAALTDRDGWMSQNGVELMCENIEISSRCTVVRRLQRVDELVRTVRLDHRKTSSFDTDRLE